MPTGSWDSIIPRRMMLCKWGSGNGRVSCPHMQVCLFRSCCKRCLCSKILPCYRSRVVLSLPRQDLQNINTIPIYLGVQYSPLMTERVRIKQLKPSNLYMLTVKWPIQSQNDESEGDRLHHCCLVWMKSYTSCRYSRPVLALRPKSANIFKTSFCLSIFS